MRLPFIDRDEETRRLRTLVERREGSLAVIYGRRRCGKSRLLAESLPKGRSIYYVGDDRESALQRASLATEIARLIPGFDRVTYPEWDALLSRWWDEAKPGMVLALDEFPALAGVAREVPSLLQKYIDQRTSKGVHLILAGSSQRMMQGLVLHRTAPLFGRATEILKISALPVGWISRAFSISDPTEAIRTYSVWGGVPRYWELAADHADLESAVKNLVLTPLGALHEEPARILLDDIRDTTQASSILSLIGQGCHRTSEIAGRMGKPATSLSRPLQRLIELELIHRQLPFGASLRQTKKTLYQISDPFMRFWYRFVEPNRSRLEVRRLQSVADEVHRHFSQHVGQVWEELARQSVPLVDIWGRTWKPASRWWGAGLDRRPVEIDVVTESVGGDALLLGEAKWTDKRNAARILGELKHKAENAPFIGKRRVFLALWLTEAVNVSRDVKVLTPRHLLRYLR